MIDAQIRYWTMVENKRHNQAQEEYWNLQQQEAERSNRAREDLTRYQTDTQAETSRYVADTNAAASRYASDAHLAASRYAADKGYAGTVYSSGVNAETQRIIAAQNIASQQRIAEMQAATSRYATDMQTWANTYATDQSALSSRYATSVNAATSTYRTDVESEDRNARLAFDRQTQLVVNSLNEKKVALEELRTQVQNANTKAQTEKILNDIEVSLTNLNLAVNEYELHKEAQAVQNALNEARTVETWVKAASTGVDVVGKTANLVDRLLNSLHGGNLDG